MKSHRSFKSRLRTSGVRSPKLIIIACEGTHTERIYFEDMTSPDYFRKPGVYVEVLEHDNTASSPKNILSYLDNFRKKYSLLLKQDDQLWLVIDRDNWTLQELSSVASECQQKYDTSSNSQHELSAGKPKITSPLSAFIREARLRMAAESDTNLTATPGASIMRVPRGPLAQLGRAADS